ncbi:MAG: NnrS family protein [Lautropia sp.]
MKPAIAPIAASTTPGGRRPVGWPVLRLGFRPFYLGASVFAVIAIPYWIAMYLGGIPATLAVAPLPWHAHEMLFGFAVAVIVGFLLTAGKAWTGLDTPRGARLGALFATWLAARLAAVVAPYTVYAILDLLLLPVGAMVLLDVLVRARNRRNFALAGILLLLALANLCFHLAMLGVVDVPPMQALHAGLALVVTIECVIAGRVVPAFTRSATPGLAIESDPRLERATLALTVVALACWVLPSPPAIGAASLGAAALAHAFRQWRWKPWVTRDRPILWILHASYAWLPLGFLLLAFAQAGLIPASAGVHALAVGATGGLIIGMLTRTARGHTGRALKASRPEVIAYALVMLAALLRVLLPLVAPQWLVWSLIGSATAWATAFALYAVVFAPWLTTTRADGKDG